jgi:hypothetical protein
MTTFSDAAMAPGSLDDETRIRDFFLRHGGAGGRPLRRGESEEGLMGWSELAAADGHILRCDWSRQGSRTEMRYREIAPAAPAAPPQTPDLEPQIEAQGGYEKSAARDAKSNQAPNRHSREVEVKIGKNMPDRR